MGGKFWCSTMSTSPRPYTYIRVCVCVYYRLHAFVLILITGCSTITTERVRRYSAVAFTRGRAFSCLYLFTPPPPSDVGAKPKYQDRVELTDASAASSVTSPDVVTVSTRSTSNSLGCCPRPVLRTTAGLLRLGPLLRPAAAAEGPSGPASAIVSALSRRSLAAVDSGWKPAAMVSSRRTHCTRGADFCFARHALLYPANAFRGCLQLLLPGAARPPNLRQTISRGQRRLTRSAGMAKTARPWYDCRHMT